LYLVTNFFADQEPLKWKLRHLSTELASFSLSLNRSLFADREFAGLGNRKIIMEILTLLQMCQNVGLISDTNHILLSQELVKYLDFIGFPAGMEEKDGRAVLSESFFATPHREIETPAVAPGINIKDKIVKEYLPTVHLEKLPTVDKDLGGNPLKQFGAVSVKKNSRQSIIIGLLKRKKEIMIKDVSPLISGCSEKTIQRELSAMVAAGVLRKIGEKRWSRYSLA
jgi:hypothetical protein